MHGPVRNAIFIVNICYERTRLGFPVTAASTTLSLRVLKIDECGADDAIVRGNVELKLGQIGGYCSE
ncbi:MAG TPA: hypothetical protein VHP14_14050 [Anaerolineales bacterium]|nr:hypothetical protein [Anaerolineales bacterium]